MLQKCTAVFIKTENFALLPTLSQLILLYICYSIIIVYISKRFFVIKSVATMKAMCHFIQVFKDSCAILLTNSFKGGERSTCIEASHWLKQKDFPYFSYKSHFILRRLGWSEISSLRMFEWVKKWTRLATQEYTCIARGLTT